MRLSKLYLICSVVFGLCLVSALIASRTSLAAGTGTTPDNKSSQPSQAAVRGAVHGFDTNNLDRSVSPCQDFFQFADGGWIKNNPIPSAFGRYGRFEMLADQNQQVLHQILEDSARNTTAKKGSNEQKIGSYYYACMNTAAIEAEGAKPIEPELKQIQAINNIQTLSDAIGHLQTQGVNAIFRFGASADPKNSNDIILGAGQGGLGLPNRDNYFGDDQRSQHIREEYLKHVANMLVLLGDDPAKAAQEASTVMEIETKLAGASMTRIQQRDPDATYHKMDIAGLKSLAPTFGWDDYFKSYGLTRMAPVNVSQPDFFKAVNQQLTATSIEDWKTYLRWHLVSSAAPGLSEKFANEAFHFNGTVLNGITEQQPRWKRCVGATDRALGEALGQVYVEATFTAKTKERALTMVRNLEAALRTDLATLSWMGEATRKEALTKLDAYMEKIGYPNKWRDYSALEISRQSYAANVLAVRSFDHMRSLDRIGKPVDRAEWGMTPPTVNAYYNPSQNEIVFPAGILQPPFYDPQADDAFNYGGMGAVIGHEMTHGFDDQGAKFDAKGNLRNWFTDADLKAFKERAACVSRQFSSYQVNGQNVKGDLVLGESIADLGGLTIALAAYHKSLEGKPAPKEIDGFTPDQRFFLGWATVWASSIRPEQARQLIENDPHAPSHFRANGPLSNMPDFAKAFSCKEGDPMVRAISERCQIW